MKHVFWLIALLGTTVQSNTLQQTLTQQQLYATMSIVTNFILDDNTITHNGTTYKKVTSPYTGRVWLDRNLGASKVCTSLDDTACYGDYYQWGRMKDGHESPNSSTTSTQATNVSSAGSSFITDDGTNSFDWAEATDPNGAQRATNWLKSDGSSVCPVGFRVPTVLELQKETINKGVIDNDTAFSNFLKIPVAGNKDTSGNLINQDTASVIWASSTEGINSHIVFILPTTSGTTIYPRALGATVRCIQTQTSSTYYHNGTLYGTVKSPYTNRIWLDRNLGASRICTAIDDVDCYGDYYQWGRLADGHQKKTSNATNVQATDINNAGTDFIIDDGTYVNDWARLADTNGSLRSANWAKTDATSICPLGFRVPTQNELKSETINQNVTNITTAFTNFLKLPASGDRAGFYNGFSQQGIQTEIWTNSLPSISTFFTNSVAEFVTSLATSGKPVRCIKD